ncbi:hypothetical protein G6F37_003595 [Rhizopus arrhizus]|nr:hypothetical protein G6F38_005222 [Rhizopus arrhizus]KAG1160865.1 hypothetical protein G6F37_003595 [Rhizopus arrhizus]
MYPQQKLQKDTTEAQSFTTIKEVNTRLLQSLHAQQRKEPIPSATDAKPNVTMSIAEIADFSSTIVYLIWHARRQSVMDLHSSSKAGQQILNATQLSESVVLLSLKYIAILLQNSPHIQGADGSEYRLFTVALMLANKFLDDNTFTNKTWSEVTGMKVTDLNIMELEFLDVLQFRLTVKKEEYERWRTALYDFRHQLLCVPEEIQRQKLMETVAQSRQQEQYYRQQQSARNYYLFSKPQHSYPAVIHQGPLTRVQLRIPPHPVYRRVSGTPVVITPVYAQDNTPQPFGSSLYKPEDFNHTTHSYYYQNSNHTASTNTPISDHHNVNLLKQNSYKSNTTTKNMPPPSAYYNPYHSTFLA